MEETEEALLGREDESPEVLCHANQSARGLQGGGHTQADCS